MKKIMTILSLLTLSYTAHANASDAKVLYGMSLEASALVIEDFKSEGLKAERLGPNECGAHSARSGNFCVVATGKGVTRVLSNMSLEDSALVIEDFKSEGLNAERLGPNECGADSSHSGNYCVIATK